MSRRHFIVDMICTTQHKHGIMHESKKPTWKTCILGIILPKPTKPMHQTQQNIKKPYSNIIFSNLNKKTQNSRNQGLETWNTLRKRENSYLFLKIGEGLMKKMEVLWVKMVVLEEGEADKTMKQHVMQGKTEKFLKTILDLTLLVQNMRFLQLEWVASKSLGQVTKIQCDKIWKICLTVFHDWKVHSQVSHDGSCEAFWVNLWLELPLAN